MTARSVCFLKVIAVAPLVGTGQSNSTSSATPIRSYRRQRISSPRVVAAAAAAAFPIAVFVVVVVVVVAAAVAVFAAGTRDPYTSRYNRGLLDDTLARWGPKKGAMTCHRPAPPVWRFNWQTQRNHFVLFSFGVEVSQAQLIKIHLRPGRRFRKKDPAGWNSLKITQIQSNIKLANSSYVT